MSRSNRSLLAPLCALACLTLAATARAEEPTTLFEVEPELHSRRIVIAPLNLGVRAEPELVPGIAPVWEQVLGHFRAQDLPVAALEGSSARALWNEVISEARAEQPTADVYAVYGRFARRIAEQVDCSAVVFASLVTRVAKVNGRTARWDGASRYLVIPGRDYEQVDAIPEGGFKVMRQGVRGEIAAASLHVAVVSPQGELRFEGAGGLALLQKLVEGRGDEIERVALAGEAWQDAEGLRAGVDLALRKPLPASQARR